MLKSRMTCWLNTVKVFQSVWVVGTHTESLLAVQRGKLISENPEEEARQKAIKSLLNKVTPEKYAVILEKLMQVEIPSVLSLSGLIDQVGHPPAFWSSHPCSFLCHKSPAAFT